MTSRYIDQIDAMIDLHRTEIENRLAEITKLENARDVIGMLTDNDAKRKTMTLDVAAPAKTGAITIRKIEGKYTPVAAVPKPKQKRAPRGKTVEADYTRRITAVLATYGPLPTGDIADHMGLVGGTIERKALHRVLHSIKNKGLVVKNETGRFTLPSQADAPEDAPREEVRDVA